VGSPVAKVAKEDTLDTEAREEREDITVALVDTEASVDMVARVVKVVREEVVVSSFKNVLLSVHFHHHPVIPIRTVKVMENTVVVVVPVMILRSVWHREHLVPVDVVPVILLRSVYNLEHRVPVVVVPVIPVPFVPDLEFPVPVIVVPVIQVPLVLDLEFPVPVAVVPDPNPNFVVTKIITSSLVVPVPMEGRVEKEEKVARVEKVDTMEVLDTTGVLLLVLVSMMISVLI